MKIKPIENEKEHQWALRVLRKLRGVEKGSEEYQYREVLKALVLKYEKDHYPYGEPEFEDWVESLQIPGVVEKKLAEIQEAEQFVEQADKFEEHRIEVVRQFMQKKGLKQRDLVEILDRDKSYISQLLNGRKPFPLTVISKLHHFLGVPYEDLVPPPEAFEEA